MHFPGFRLKRSAFTTTGMISVIAIVVFSCKKSDPATMTDPGTGNPPASIFDTIFGTHQGTCYYYRKTFSTGTEQFDTIPNSTLELTKLDSMWYSISGCATYDYVKHIHEGWSATDTVVGYEYFQGGNHWTLKIDLLQHTILAEHVFIPGTSSPYYEKYTGKWDF